MGIPFGAPPPFLSSFPHPAAGIAQMPCPPHMRPQECHHFRRNMRVQAAKMMAADGLSRNQIAGQLHCCYATVVRYLDT